MPHIGQVDMILADPPYGTTACKWDSIIPLDRMWEQLKRIVKPNGAIVMTASQPFTTTLISSNMGMFKYCWVWKKTMASNFAQAKKQPFKKHEDVCIFYTAQPVYNPQMEIGKPYKDNRDDGSRNASVGSGKDVRRIPINNGGTRYPSSIQVFSNGNNGNVQPTQKPVALMEYMIKTYTNEGETILDFTIGSGTTAVAAQKTGRRWIGIEKEKQYCDITIKRLEEE